MQGTAMGSTMASNYDNLCIRIISGLDGYVNCFESTELKRNMLHQLRNICYITKTYICYVLYLYTKIQEELIMFLSKICSNLTYCSITIPCNTPLLLYLHVAQSVSTSQKGGKLDPNMLSIRIAIAEQDIFFFFFS